MYFYGKVKDVLMSEFSTHQPVGVIGAGSFGTAITNLLAYNADVLLYSRNLELVNSINSNREHLGVRLSASVQATSDLQKLAQECRLLFPIVPSTNFRKMMHNLGPFLRPYHMLIHGTKGFDTQGISDQDIGKGALKREDVHTMSEVIKQESVVVRVGCLSGPNLASEIMEGQPTATLIASPFDEVIHAGKMVLDSKHFHVFGSHEILGAELAGALKNVIALGSGILKGKGLGKNLQAMLITRGLTEMVHFGKAMGASGSAFFGTAGIGDLVATATSKRSRNYTFGFRLGKGESIAEISSTMPELAEGVRTLQITRQLANYYKLRVPITEMLHRIVFEEFDIDRALEYLMTYPYDVDVDFL